MAEVDYGLFEVYDDDRIFPWVKAYQDFSSFDEALPRFQALTTKIILSIVFFVAVHFISRFFWKNTKVYSTLTVKDRVFMSEKVCSTIHGVVCGFWALGLVLLGTFSENFHYYPKYSDFLFTFSLGYEIYDIFTMVYQGQDQVEMYLHHLVLIICYTLQIWYRVVTFVTTTMLVTELTVIPSNIHWYCKTFQLKESFLFRLNKIMRIVSFLGLRLWAGPFIFATILVFQIDLFYSLHWFGKFIIIFFPALLTALNWYWTYMMWKLFWIPERTDNSTKNNNKEKIVSVDNRKKKE